MPLARIPLRVHMGFLVGALGLLLAAPTFAGGSEGCFEAASQGQVLREQHKLIEARNEFRVCAQSLCPPTQAACEGWLEVTERSIATVVVTAKDPTGEDLVDVDVHIDGRPFATRLDGLALPINPGLHTFDFELADGSDTARRVVVREGERNQSVAVVLRRTTAVAARPQDTETTPPNGASQPAGPSTDGRRPSESNPLKTAGWALGAVGIAGVAAGAVFTGVALRDWARCADELCEYMSLFKAAKAWGTAADVSFATGGVLFATGAALVLLVPNVHHDPAGQLRVLPMVANSGGGVLAGWDW